MNTITIELSAEDRARLDRLAAALESAGQPAAAEKPAATPPEPAAQEEPKNDPPPQPKSAPAVTMDQLRELAQAMLAPGSSKKEAVRALITGYARKLSDIPADKWPEVYAKLTDLKEGRA